MHEIDAEIVNRLLSFCNVDDFLLENKYYTMQGVSSEKRGICYLKHE